MTSNLTAYATYKESNVPWFGNVPAHWQVRRNKLFLKEIVDHSKDGREELLTVSQYTGVTARRERITEEGELLSNASSLIGYKRVKPGDLVMNIMLAWNGSLGVSTIAGIASPAYCVFRATGSIEPRYLHYLFRTPMFTSIYKTVSTGIVDSRLRLYPDIFMRLPSILPPLDEQSAIVRYLDHVDRRIRNYIRVKRRMIELLNEQKQAIITRAVTRGLDPNVRLKPSGSIWFSMIPETWQVLKLRRLILRAADGPHVSPNYVERGIPFLSARNVKVDRWALDDAKLISDEDYLKFSKRVRPEKGDVLYTKGGTTGIARVVDLDFPFQVWVHIAVLKVNSQLIIPEFLALALNSTRCYEQSQLFTRGATNQDLGLNRMVEIDIPISPTLSEQEQIVSYVRPQLSKVEETVQDIEREIHIIREYRTRLIADVVTGKVDVREVAAQMLDESEELVEQEPLKDPNDELNADVDEALPSDVPEAEEYA